METRTYYPGTNQLQTVVTPIGTTTYAWYPNPAPNAGLLKSVTGPDATVTRYAYDNQGQLPRTGFRQWMPCPFIQEAMARSLHDPGLGRVVFGAEARSKEHPRCFPSFGD